MFNKLYYGAAFYPELWPSETVKEDIELMKKTGINIARIGEFAWAAIEPEENNFNLSVLKETIELLYENGIDTVLCTPTATPPIWVSHGHPDRMHVDQDGNIMSHGARQHVCTNHPYMRERSRIITEKMAVALGNLPGVVAWQTDNEFKCHVAECFCSTCLNLWHEWLKKRYGTVENLHDAWGTNVWSQRYQEFEQVPAPVKAPYSHNASLSSMYRLFERENIVAFQQEQLDIIRMHSKAPITHNTSIWFRLHQENLFSDLDFFSFDRYELSSQYSWAILMYDLGRNVKKDRKFWMMETSPSHGGNINSSAKIHPDGYLAALSSAAYSLGCGGYLYWLWRQQRTGCEMPHGSIISAWGEPTAGYPNVVNALKCKDALEPIIQKTKIADPNIALTYSDVANIYFTTESLEGLSYTNLFYNMYSTLLSTGIPRNILFENAEIGNEKILLSPFMPCITPQYLKKTRDFVHAGGTWIVGPMSGGRTAEHTVHTTAALGELEDFAGVQVLNSVPLSGAGVRGKAFGITAPLGHWCTFFRCNEAEMIGEVVEGFGSGLAFISERKIGKGRVVLIGATPVDEQPSQMIAEMIRFYAKENNIKTSVNTSSGTLGIQRYNEKDDYWIIINVDGKGGTFSLESQALDEMEGQDFTKGIHKIMPYEIRALRMKE